MKIKVHNYTVLIDREDYLKISDYCMWVMNTEYNYVYIDKFINGKRSRHRLHRYLMGVKNKTTYVDHINGNPLDNRKCNLRLCDNSQNLGNRAINKKNTSGYKGVSKTYGKTPKKWRARIQNKHIGRFYTAEEAAIAYNKMAKKVYGEFAKLNEVTK